MRLPWMTTRRWMVAVAIMAFVAVMSAVWHLERWRRRYRDLAGEMYRSEVACAEAIVANSFPLRGPGYHTWIPEGFDPMTAPLPAEREYLRRRYVHFSRMRQKYEFAAVYPWLPVELDPPDPARPPLRLNAE